MVYGSLLIRVTKEIFNKINYLIVLVTCVTPVTPILMGVRLVYSTRLAKVSLNNVAIY